MGVYIPGMEMPSGCFACPMVSGYMLLSEGKREPRVKAGLCRLNRKTEVQIDGRPQDCPLVHVQPHGDLIDVSELIEKIERDTPLSAVFKKTIRHYLGDAPTIIPASEEGDT